MRMFQRVKCGQILRILSADVTGKVRRCGCWQSIPFCLLSYLSGLTVMLNIIWYRALPVCDSWVCCTLMHRHHQDHHHHHRLLPRVSHVAHCHLCCLHVITISLGWTRTRCRRKQSYYSWFRGPIYSKNGKSPVQVYLILINYGSGSFCRSQRWCVGSGLRADIIWLNVTSSWRWCTGRWRWRPGRRGRRWYNRISG